MRAISARSRASPMAAFARRELSSGDPPVGSMFTMAGPSGARCDCGKEAGDTTCMTVSSAQAHIGSEPPHNSTDPAAVCGRIAVQIDGSLLQVKIRHIELECTDGVRHTAVPVRIAQ